MMTPATHPNEETLQRFRHAELPPRARAELQEHLRDCAECAERHALLARDERDAFLSLAALDKRPPSRPAAQHVIARARREHRWTILRRAAAIVLLTSTASVAFALPGSPLRSWLADAVAQLMGRSTPAPTSQAAPATSGVAVLPGERFVIRFTEGSLNGETLVSLSPDSVIAVRATLGSATFTSEANRLLIEPHVAQLSVDIAIPRGAPLVEIQVGDQRVFLKRGATILAPGATTSAAPYRIPLTR